MLVARNNITISKFVLLCGCNSRIRLDNYLSAMSRRVCQFFCCSLIIFQIWLQINRKTPADIEVVVGSNQWNSSENTFKVKRLIPHEKYNQPKFAFNIGLIHLKSSIEFNDKINAIEYSMKDVPEGSNLQVVSFGSSLVRNCDF